MEKLVRDHIPHIIGEHANYRVWEDEEKLPSLIAKLKEEYRELMYELENRPDNTQRVVEEISDVLEVLAALCAQLNVNWAKVEREKEFKAIMRGKFTKGYILKIRE